MPLANRESSLYFLQHWSVTRHCQQEIQWQDSRLPFSATSNTVWYFTLILRAQPMEHFPDHLRLVHSDF